MSLHSKLTSMISQSQAEYEARHKQSMENIQKQEIERKNKDIQLMLEVLTDESIEKIFNKSTEYNMGSIVTVALINDKISLSRLHHLHATGAISVDIPLKLNIISAHEAAKSPDVQERLSDLLKDKIKVEPIGDIFDRTFGFKIEVMRT